MANSSALRAEQRLELRGGHHRVRLARRRDGKKKRARFQLLRDAAIAGVVERVEDERVLLSVVEEDPWSLAKPDSDWFAPSESGFMINYRIDDMDGMLARATRP